MVVFKKKLLRKIFGHRRKEGRSVRLETTA
jgi:hypothetical protein